MKGLATTLVVATFAWPLLLGASVWELAHGREPIWAAVLYGAASKVCHQLPERSFHTAGIEWPVCGRCSGLYLAAPLGAIAAAVALRRRADAGRQLIWLAVAAIPTALTLALEWLRLAPVNNLARALSALPLGAMIAFVVVRAAAGRS